MALDAGSGQELSPQLSRQARAAGLLDAETEYRLAVAWRDHSDKAALDRLSAMGLPTRRDEYWRYTDPSDLNRLPTPAAALFDAGDEPAVFGEIDRLRLVFVDGVFDAAQSDALALAGVTIEPLTKAGALDIHWARPAPC